MSEEAVNWEQVGEDIISNDLGLGREDLFRPKSTPLLQIGYGRLLPSHRFQAIDAQVVQLLDG
jgi:hypothetical protein